MHEACSEGCHDDIVALFQQMLVLPKCQWDGSSRCVTEVLNVDHHLFHGQFQAFCHCLDDAHIGLMRYYPLDVVLVQTIALGNQGAVITHVSHRIAEYRAPLLIEVVQTVIYREMAGGRHRAAGFQVQEGKSLSVSAEIGIHHTDVLLLRTFQQHSSSTVAEERTGSPVFIVNDGRHLIGTYYNNLLVTAALYHRCCHVKHIEKSTASSPEVESKSILQSKLAQHDAGCRRELIISR